MKKAKQTNQFAHYKRSEVEAMHKKVGETFSAEQDLASTESIIDKLQMVDASHNKQASQELAEDLQRYRDWRETLHRLFPELITKINK